MNLTKKLAQLSTQFVKNSISPHYQFIPKNNYFQTTTSTAHKGGPKLIFKQNDDQHTIFDKVANKEIPVDVVYEDEQCLAFRDANPQAPVHILLIPKNKNGLSQLQNARPENKDILGHLMLTVGTIAKQEGLEEGYRVVINDGKLGQQTVFHLHLHILGGTQLTWPPGCPQ